MKIRWRKPMTKPTKLAKESELVLQLVDNL